MRTIYRLLRWLLDVLHLYCPECARPWSAHHCPSVAAGAPACVGCGKVMPDGAVRFHTGEWLCRACKAARA